MPITIHSFFDTETATYSYIVSDNETQKAAIIDSVLNYDTASGKTNTHSADQLLNHIASHELSLEWILETHIHADHLTASHYLKNKAGGKIGIGSGITEVLSYWVPLFNIEKDTPLDGSQFDVLFEDGVTFPLGNTSIKVLHTPGHTPACVSYLIDHAIFVGDTIFMPDVGTARTDFPGGSPSIQYDSIMRILDLPEDTQIYVGHDYPTQGREANCVSSVKEQRKQNILIGGNISKGDYVKIRAQRDIGKPVPKLLLPGLQVNLRAGTFGEPESNGVQYIKIPVNVL